MTMIRRDLFRGALATGAMLALPRARAATTPGPRVLIQVFLSGGMDAVLTTDPKTRREVAPEIDVPYGEDEIQALGPHRVGPVLAPLGRHLSRAAIVNGVIGGTVSHVTGVEQIHEMRRVFPGTGLGLSGTLGLLAGREPPLGDVRFNRYNTFISMKPSNGRTLTIKRPETPDESVVARLHALAQDPRRKAAMTAALAEQLHGRVDPRAMPIEVASRLVAAIPEGPLPPIRPVLGTEDHLHPLDIVLRDLLYLVEHDLTAAVYMWFGSWDTHELNQKLQTETGAGLCKYLIALLEELEQRRGRDGVALSERVGLVLSSELGRMPILNLQNGKDHFPQHPVILLGPGIRPGQYGETNARMIGLPISAQTGKPSASKRDFVPSVDDVGATILHWFGVDDPASVGYLGRRLDFALA
ncbi:MAG TPA: DUF1501 domain-containing protein [Kofleriaceae bacterium]